MCKIERHLSMTAETMPDTPHSEPLQAALRKVGRRMRRAALLQGAAAWLTLLLAVWLAACLADNLLRLPGSLRLPLSVAALAATLTQAWRRIGRVLFRTMTPERVARELERRCAVEDNLLINACQFEGGGVPEWTDSLVRSARSQTAVLDPEIVWRKGALRRGLWALSGLGLAWFLYAAGWPEQAANAWGRLARPLADRPPVGRFHLAAEPSRDVSLFEGEGLEVVARTEGAASDEPPPVLRRGAIGQGFRNAVESPMEPHGGTFSAQLLDVRESFEFSVAAGGTWTPAVRVRVRTLPRVRTSSFLVTPPAYLAGTPRERPGVPQPLAGPQGATVRLRAAFDASVAEALWTVGGRKVALTGENGTWTGETVLEKDGRYTLEVTVPGTGRRFQIADGPVFAEADAPPSVALEGTEPNRFVFPGEELPLEAVAVDDGGLQALWLEWRVPAASGVDGTILRRWAYEGPPGRKGETRERWTLRIDPATFTAGGSYVLEACARDFNPEGAVARSRPVVLRVLDPRSGTPGAVADPVADALSQAVEAQRRALGLTRNLNLHREEALEKDSLPNHAKSMTAQQTAARDHGDAALGRLREGGRSADVLRLETLVRHEMAWALASIGSLAAASADDLPVCLAALEERQFHILNELLALLGQWRAKSAASGRPGNAPPPAATLRDAAAQLQEQLKDFIEVQKRIVRESRPLAAKGPDDLTAGEEDILGALAREEARQAVFVKDAVDDFSKLPLQDFSDGSLADEFHTVYQEVEKAAAELYAKKVELAVPLEQSGLEMAEELVHNLEKWLSDKPDHQKWLMEEPPDMPLPPMAELPAELEDIVGELLDEEQTMDEEIEDVTSSWNDSLDKGAGWDVADGPISDMSAKAVTGNLLPNQMEIGGRAGEGRSGRSHGQMVEGEASGKGGRQTPTRLTPSPFEAGSVADRSEEDPGGATGGGKLSGFAGQGLRGPAPTPRLEKMARLAGKQAEIRQEAERLQLHLRAWKAPGGDLDMAVEAMRKVESAARDGQGAVLRQAFDETLNAMRQARTALQAEAQVRREQAPLARQQGEALWATLRDQLPAGYEEMAAAYFRRLAAEAVATPDGPYR